MQLLLTIGVSLFVAVYSAARHQQTSPTIETDPFSAADVYAEDDPALKPARLIHEARPNYTSAAMRSRIEGVVKMTAIVERNGTIGAIRVTQSLDPEYGLDATAVETLKQWKFLPATKDGVAVRVRIQVEMSFSLGGGSAKGPTLSWPVPFAATRSSLEESAAGWTEQQVAAGPLRITVRLPGTWTVSTAPESKLFVATLDNPRYPRAFVMARPFPVPFDLTATMSDRELDKMADQVKKDVTSDGGFKLLKFGQIRAPLRLWFWAEMTRGLPQSSKVHETMHAWMFTTTERRQQLNVFCSVVEPVDSYAVEMREELNRAGGDFAAMISRIEIVAK